MRIIPKKKIRQLSNVLRDKSIKLSTHFKKIKTTQIDHLTLSPNRLHLETFFHNNTFNSN